MRRKAFPVALGALAVGIGVIVYTGPGRAYVRGWVGDIAIIVFLVALLALVPVGRARTRLLAVGGFAIGVELLQSFDWVSPDAPWFVHLTFGSTFDPVDILFYAMGLAIAAGFERWWADAD